MTFRRIALALQYDGSAYHGWQAQLSNLPTVQSAVEKALSEVANHPVTVFCAGRTDAGVHATSQIIHFDTSAERDSYSWVFGANSNLPSSVSVLWSRSVDMDFHARYSASFRRYRYLIYNHDIRPSLLRHQVTGYYRPLNIEKMQQAAKALIGEHDFNAYRSRSCQAKSSVRTIYRLEMTRHRCLIVLDVTANGFLHHMVRNIAGVLMTIGSGQAAVAWAKEILLGRDRTLGGITARPNGLYLVEVGYPMTYDLPKTEIGPFFLDKSLL